MRYNTPTVVYKYLEETPLSSEVADQYTEWPYPKIPLFAQVPKDQLWQLNHTWLHCRSGLPPNLPHTYRPKIWITGAGTFQPYLLAQANPTAEILATDISQTSLDIARRRCSIHRLGQSSRQIYFQPLDLNNTDEYPQSEFDWIECYGVLMNLKDPSATLNELSRRLKPTGFLRLMVYPHYGRQRIFQIQRIGRLLGLSHKNKNAPSQLRELFLKLRKEHPLSYAFHSYDDSRTAEGIVDGFLHAGDRAFTAIELAKMIDAAGLQLGFCMHRPWGQPVERSKSLGIESYDPALGLHYLDLWQELRSNFVLCLIRKDAVLEGERKASPHPLFYWGTENLGLKHRSRLLRMSLTGTRVQSRTESGPVRLSSRECRQLMQGKSPSSLDSGKKVIPTQHLPVGKILRTTPSHITPNPHFQVRIGEKVPNPMYDHLLDAFIFSDQWGHCLRPPFKSTLDQIDRWEQEGSPLEDSIHSFGLTPLGTYRAKPRECIELSQRLLTHPPSVFAEVKLKNEASCREEIRTFLKQFTWIPILDDVTLRELWVLLCSYPHLSLDFEPAS